MSIARVHYVKSARQRYAKEAKVDETGAQVVTPVTRKSGAPRVRKSGAQVVRRIKVANREKPLPMPKCGRCGTTIEVGQPYRWFTVGFRGYPQTRCMKPQCAPKMSELESSKLADVYAAQEEFESAISALDGTDPGDDASDINAAVQAFGEQLRTTADEYAEADSAMGGSQATESYERSETLGSAADELESWEASTNEPDFDGCDNEAHEDPDGDDETGTEAFTEVERGSAECDDCQRIKSEWWAEAVQEARDAVEGVELP